MASYCSHRAAQQGSPRRQPAVSTRRQSSEEIDTNRPIIPFVEEAPTFILDGDEAAFIMDSRLLHDGLAPIPRLAGADR